MCGVSLCKLYVSVKQAPDRQPVEADSKHRQGRADSKAGQNRQHSRAGQTAEQGSTNNGAIQTIEQGWAHSCCSGIQLAGHS